MDRKTVRRMLKDDLGLSRRQMVKTLSMGESADRDAQFRRMKKIKAKFLKQGFAVLSVDTKKKELLGKFYRSGPAWTNGRVQAWDHDFPSSSWGKVIPYGVYDLARNEWRISGRIESLATRACHPPSAARARTSRG